MQSIKDAVLAMLEGNQDITSYNGLEEMINGWNKVVHNIVS